MADSKANIDILINTANSAKNVRELRGALKELVSAQESVDKSSPDFEKLISGINETEGRIGDLNDSFRTFAGSGMERLTTSTFLLKDGFNSLDLEKVKIGFEGLKQLPKTLSTELTKLTGIVKKLDFKSLGTSMKGLADTGVGSLTKSIVQLGKAILTNPILLLAGVITGLIAIVIKFYDKITPLRLAVEAFGSAIDVVVQSLKDFADWIGITNFAASDAADKQIENAKKTEDALVRRYEHEIAMAEAAGEEIYAIEKKKLDAVKKSNLDQVIALQRKINLEGDANNEKKKLLEEALLAADDAYKKGLVLDTKYNKKLSDEAKKNAKEKNDNYKKELDERQKLREEFEQTLDELAIKAINNEFDREISANLLSYQNDLEKFRKKYKVNEEGLAKTSELQLRWDAYELQRTSNYQKDDLAIRQKWQTKSVAAQKQYIDTMIQLNELLIREPGKEGYLDITKTAEFLEKQFKLSQEGLDKTKALLDDEAKERKKAYEGNAFMVATIDAEINAKKEIAAKEVGAKIREVTKAYNDTLQRDELAALEIRLVNAKKGSTDELNAKIAILAKKTDMELANTELTESEKALIVARYQKELNDLLVEEENKTNLRLMSLTEAYLSERGQKNLDAIKQMASATTQILGDVAALMAQNSAQELAEFDRVQQGKIDTLRAANAQMEQDYSDNQAIQLAKFTGTEEEKRAFEIQIAQDKVRRENEAKQAEYDIALEKYEFDLSMKKKAFEQNKKMQLASAIISGALAVVNGLATQPFLPAGVIAAASAAITAGINVAKIKSTQFQDSGSPPQKPVMANPAAAGLSAAMGSSTGTSNTNVGSNNNNNGNNNFSAPSFYRLGQGGFVPNVGGDKRVYVLESDITKIQKGVQRVETRATTTLP